MTQLVGPLSAFEYIQGSLTLAFSVLSIILGSLMIYKYLKYKDKLLLFVGLSWILLISPWWPDSISFVLMLIGGGNKSYALTDNFYFLIANAFVAPIFYTWIVTFSNLVLRDKPKTKNYFVWFCVIYAIIFEVIIILMYILNYNMMGTRLEVFYVDWNPIIMFYLLSASLLLTITGVIFSAQSLKSPEKIIRLKGKFLMIAFVTFTIGIVFEVLLIVPEIDEISLITARISEMIATIFF